MSAHKDSGPGARGRVTASVTVRPRSGKSVNHAEKRITPENIASYVPSEGALKEAAARLTQLGFVINLIAPTYVSISGDPSLFERVFQVTLVAKEYPFFPGQTSGRRQVVFESDRPLAVPPSLSEMIDAVNLAPRVTYYMRASATPPAISYDHLEVPNDVARGMDALKAHERGVSGQGVALAIVDTGFMSSPNNTGAPQLHPYYVGRGYTISPVISDPGDANSGDDSVGHGTGVAACALAVAPGVTCTVYRSLNSALDAFNYAAMARPTPDIITCSWGVHPVDTDLETSIHTAVLRDRIVVLFASGDGNKAAGWPGSDRNVISVGGAFLGDDDSITASNYATSGTNPHNPQRQCPDVCGLVGAKPWGIYIALPTQPNSSLDRSFSDHGDGTKKDDGWLVASGTSASTAMVAGVCALIMQADQTLRRNPFGVLAKLATSCFDVTSGSSATGEPAGPGVDKATGAGLVQAYRAVHATDIWMRDNADTDIGLVPTTGRRPACPPHAFWTSPDIKVVAAPLADPQKDFDGAAAVDPIFNQDNYVYLRVRNRGTQNAANVAASLYYADPSTSLSFPNDWKDGSSGIPANGSITVGGATLNTQTFPVTQANGSAVTPVPFVWRLPDPSTATQSRVLPDGRIVGHFCLLSRLSSDDDPILFPTGGGSSIVADNNLSMKNEHVYSAPKGAQHMFRFLARGPRNVTDLGESVLVADVAGLPDRTEVDWAVAEKHRKTVHVVHHRRRSAPSRKGRKDVTAQTVVLGKIVLEPAEEALCRVTVRLPHGTKPGRYRLHIAQTMAGEVAGGVTLVSRVT